MQPTTMTLATLTYSTLALVRLIFGLDLVMLLRALPKAFTTLCNCLRFALSSVAAHGDGASVEFLMNHEVVALLETVASKREGTGDDAGRMRAALDFCKDRTHCTELGPQNLQSFCRSVRGKLQTMTDLLDDEVRFCADLFRSNTSYGVARECRRVQHVRTNSLHYAK